VLGDAGLERRAHSPQPFLADRNRLAHAGDLVSGFDAAGALGDLAAVAQFDAQSGEGGGPFGIDPVDRQSAAGAAVMLDEIGQFRRPFLRPFRDMRTRGEINHPVAVRISSIVSISLAR